MATLIFHIFEGFTPTGVVALDSETPSLNPSTGSSLSLETKLVDRTPDTKQRQSSLWKTLTFWWFSLDDQVCE